MKLKFFFISTYILLCLSCDFESEKHEAEKTCSARITVDDFPIEFRGYFTDDADTIEICIKSSNGKQTCYKDTIPEFVTDSVRHIRQFRITQQFVLADTICIKFKSEPTKKIYGFSYGVHKYYEGFSDYYECNLNSICIDGQTHAGNAIMLVLYKKGYKMLDEKEFKGYYHKIYKPST